MEMALQLTPYAAPDFAALGLNGAPDARFARAPKDGVAPENYTASLFYTSDAPEKGDMILFFEAKDADAAKEIAQAMENDLEQQRNASNNYYPEKYALLEGVEPKVDGVYVYAVASEDRDTILQIIEKALHQ